MSGQLWHPCRSHCSCGLSAAGYNACLHHVRLLERREEAKVEQRKARGSAAEDDTNKQYELAKAQEVRSLWLSLLCTFTSAVQWGRGPVFMLVVLQQLPGMLCCVSMHTAWQLTGIICSRWLTQEICSPSTL